jgi:hypothetical protein
MVKAGSKAGLALKALKASLVGSQLYGQHLDDNGASKPGVDGLIDFAHPARAELFPDLVMGERFRDRHA